jgi:hypothetical protein
VTRSRPIALGLAVAVAAALIVLAGPSSAPASPGSPTRPSAQAPAAQVGTGAALQLASQSSWSSVGGTFEAAVQVRGAPAGARLAVAVHPKVSGRIRFEQSTAGEGLGTPLRPGLPEVPLAERFAGPAGVVGLAIPLRTSAEPGAVQLPSSGTAGTYPVSLRLLDAEGELLDELVTHLVVLPSGPDAAGPLGVAVVVPVDLARTGQAAVTPSGQPDLDPAAVEHLGAAVRALEAVPDVPATLGAVPESIDALAVLATDDQPTDQPTDEPGADLLERLRAATEDRQVASATYAPLALGSWVAQAGVDDAASHYLASQRQAGRATLDEALATTTSSRTALIDPTVDPAALRWLGQHGARQVVVPEAQLDELRDTPDEARWALPFAVQDDQGTEVPALMADATLVERLTWTGDPVLDGHLTLANLAVLWADLPALARGVVLAPPADLDVHATTWEVVLRGLAEPTGEPVSPVAGNVDLDGSAPRAQPVVAASTLDELFERVTPEDLDELPVQPYRSDEAQPLGAFPASAARVGGRVASFTTMAGLEPSRPLARQVLVAGGVGLPAVDRAAHLAATEASLDEQLAGVVASDAQRVTLTDPQGTLPLTLENRLPFDVDVQVVMASDKLVLLDGETIAAHLPAGTTTRLEIAVESRVTGAFPLDVSVQSPDGGLAVTATRFAVRSTTISGVGLALSIGAGLFLLFWWLRHFRSVRRARRLISPNHPTRRASA